MSGKLSEKSEQFSKLYTQWESAKKVRDDACSVVYKKLARTFAAKPGTNHNPTREEMAAADAATDVFESLDRQLRALAKSVHGIAN